MGLGVRDRGRTAARRATTSPSAACSSSRARSAKADRRALYLPFGASLVITAVAAASNPFAVLVPMLSLGFVGLWGARHGEFPRRKDIVDAGAAVAADALDAPTWGIRRGGPMAEHASERIRIDASSEECLAVVLDFESYPSWARDLKQVTITERDADGRGRLVEFRAAAMGQSFKYVLAYDYTQPAGVVLLGPRLGREAAPARRHATASSPRTTAPACTTTSWSTSRSRCPASSSAAPPG